MTPHAHKQHFLACLSDPSRFSLISTLARGPLCVTELATEVGLSQSCTTRHLQALLRAGIVTSERQGKRVVFTVSVAGPEAHPVLSWAFGRDGLHAEAPPKRRPAVAARASHGLRSRPSDPARPAPDARRDEIEVTDAIVVAHDSSWEGDDSLPAAEAPAASDDMTSVDSPPEETTHFEPGPAPARASREQLDDFLL